MATHHKINNEPFGDIKTSIEANMHVGVRLQDDGTLVLFSPGKVFREIPISKEILRKIYPCMRYERCDQGLIKTIILTTLDKSHELLPIDINDVAMIEAAVLV